MEINTVDYGANFTYITYTEEGCTQTQWVATRKLVELLVGGGYIPKPHASENNPYPDYAGILLEQHGVGIVKYLEKHVELEDLIWILPDIQYRDEKD